MDLRDKIKKFPKSPGVYFWLDKNGKVLYVGRATSLRQRLSQYFQKDIDPRIAEMVGQARNIKVIATDSLLEAIILEALNIKKYWPKYNIKDRDDRSFIYIVISGGDYPKPIIIRGRDLKKFPAGKTKIFGPYQSQILVQQALRLIRRIFPYSTCVPGSGRACFDYQIGLCPGACVGAISRKDYRQNIKNIELLLAGEKKKLVKKLIKANPDKARALKQLQDVSLLAREDNLAEPPVNRIEGYDISHLLGKETYGSMVVFKNGVSEKKEYRLFKVKEAPAGDDERALTEVLTRRLKHGEWPRPDIIMIDGGTPQISFISRIFRQQNISIPLVGISKLAGDKLVFSKDTKKNFKDLAQNLKPVLLKVREEAHRFAINAGRRARRIK